MEQLLSLVGIAVMVGLCWLASVHRSAVNWRTVAWGIGLQLAFAAVLLLPDIGQDVFDAVDRGVRGLVGFSEAGSNFVFQSIEKHEVVLVAADGTKTITTIQGQIAPALKTIAFWVLPTVIFFSALMSVAYHYGLMQWLVRIVGGLMQRSMGTSGAESLSAAANIFVGQTEAPLVIRPYVDTMTMSELNAVMTAGFATVAGGVMAIYVGVVPLEGIAGHLVTASIMSAPAALAIAKVLYPETGEPTTAGGAQLKRERTSVNGLDALSSGTLEGLKLFWNIVAMLLVFFAVITMVNSLLGWVGGWFGVEISLQLLLSYVFAPFALLMGVPWDEALQVGMLLGEKLTVTELIAFIHFGEIQQSATPLSERSAIITSYALCGFANFASIGIQIGGIGGIAPERRADLARLGFRAMIGGTVAAMMTGAVAGIFLAP